MLNMKWHDWNVLYIYTVRSSRNTSICFVTIHISQSISKVCSWFHEPISRKCSLFCNIECRKYSSRIISRSSRWSFLIRKRKGRALVFSNWKIKRHFMFHFLFPRISLLDIISSHSERHFHFPTHSKFPLSCLLK